MTEPTDDDHAWSDVPPLTDREARPASPTPADGPPAGHPAKADDRPVGRPAPAYGEYAPEGWVNPVFEEQARREREAEAGRREDEIAAKRWAEAGGSAERFRGAGAVPPVRTGDGRSTANGTGVRRPPRDLLLTAILLAVGLVSVVNQLTGIDIVAGQVATEIATRYTALSNPGALHTAAAISAVGGAVLLVLAGWWCFARFRQRKPTFWIPLLAGVLAAGFSTVVFLVVVLHDPAMSAYLVQHPAG